ncbi:MAG: allantoinase PuuE [Alphaproteobacteria bacterium]|jgi:putative urate catabolism protein|nr:allantoinase PuuE [Alphaproteobacteria bacterium]
MTDAYVRDFVGYGGNPPDPQWPGDARIAISFVLNYEEGGENTVLNGDAGSETYLHETPGGAARIGQRDLNVETVYEYGARAGFWRIMEMFRERNMNFTCYGVGLALEKNPAAARAMVAAGHEIASHGYRWIDYSTVREEVERAHIRQAIQAIEQTCGMRPVGWYTGRISANTRRLIVEEGGFLYESDAYNDDLPYWVEVAGKPQLIIPYTLDNNDMKFCVPPGFSAPSGFYEYLKDAFDVLYHEGRRAPKMMSVGLHCRLAGRPGRAAALARFLDYVQGHDRVWVARRADIARHWHKVHPFKQP